VERYKELLATGFGHTEDHDGGSVFGKRR